MRWSEALAANLDLRPRRARVDEAAALLKAARSGLYPTVDLAASAGRQRLSQVGSQPLTGIDPVSNNYNVGLRAAYEVDLWGRIRSGANAAGQTLAATEFDREAIRIAVAAETARGYFSLVSADAELAILRDTLATREESVSGKDRFQERGRIRTALGRGRTRGRLRTSQLRRRCEDDRVGAAVLLGRSPRDLHAGSRPHARRGDCSKFPPGCCRTAGAAA
jgi:multidrug efflux system outer membrane protein